MLKVNARRRRRAARSQPRKVRKAKNKLRHYIMKRKAHQAAYSRLI